MALRQLEIDKRNMLAIINGARRKAYRIKATVDFIEVQENAALYFAKAEDRWREAFIPLIEGEIGDQCAHLSATFGVQFDVENVLASEAMIGYVIQFAQQINGTTNDEVARLIQQGLENGWSIPELEKQLGLTWDKWLDPDFTLDGRKLTDSELLWFHNRRPAYRLENIARTETMRASNFGSHQIYKEWGATYKEWLATPDNRTRPDHMDAWERYREGGDPGPIPMGEPYKVGGVFMMYPGDPSAPPEQVCNCRCTELPYDPMWAED